MSRKPKVCIIVSIEDDLQAQIHAACDVSYVDPRASRAELLEAVHDAERILLTPRVRADAEFFEAASKLRVLSTTSVGYAPFDIPEATRHGVVVCNTPGVLSAAVANLTMSMIFALALKLFEYEPYV